MQKLQAAMHVFQQTYHEAVCEAPLISFLEAVGYTLQAHDCWIILEISCKCLEGGIDPGAIPGKGMSPEG